MVERPNNPMSAASVASQIRIQRLRENQYRHVPCSEESIRAEIEACLPHVSAEGRESADVLDEVCVTTDWVGMRFAREVRRLIARRAGIDGFKEDILQGCWAELFDDEAWTAPVVMENGLDRDELERELRRIADRIAQRYYRRVRGHKEASNSIDRTDDEIARILEPIDRVNVHASQEESEELERAFILAGLADDDVAFVMSYEALERPKTGAERSKMSRLMNRIRPFLLGFLVAVAFNAAQGLLKVSADDAARPTTTSGNCCMTGADAPCDCTVPVQERVATDIAYKSCLGPLAFKSCRATDVILAKSCLEPDQALA